MQSGADRPFQMIVEMLEDSLSARINLPREDDLAEEQLKDVMLPPLMQYLSDGTLLQELNLSIYVASHKGRVIHHH